MTNTSFLSGSFCLLCFAAAPLAQAEPQSQSGWWASLEAGTAFVNPGSGTLEPMPNVDKPDNYSVTNFDTTAVLGLGAGYAFKSETRPDNRLGLYYDYYSPSTLSGDIEKWEYITAYTYSYKISSNTVWRNDQQDLFNWHNIVPFIEFGLGVAFNSASDYNEVPVPENPLQDRRDQPAAFEDKTNTAFAWRVGAGVNFLLPWMDNQFRVGLQYRYTDRGEVKTGGSEHYPSMNQGLNTELRSNEVMASISYIGN